MNSLAYNNVIPTLSTLYKYRVGKEASKLPNQKKSEIDDSKIKIIHTMADGSIRNSVEGYEIPYNDTTAIVYELLVKWMINKKTKLE